MGAGQGGRHTLEHKEWAHRGGLGCSFRLKHPLEARANKLHANNSLAIGQNCAHVNHAALRFEIFVPPRCYALHRNADLKIRTYGHVEARAKRSSSPAQIFARSIFLEGKSAAVAPADT
jgi:hypothetical protein